MAAAEEEGKRHRSGRRPGPVWEYFVALRSENRTLQAQCVFCGHTCGGVAGRMRRHVVSACPSATPAAIEELSDESTSSKKRRVVADDTPRPAPAISPAAHRAEDAALAEEAPLSELQAAVAHQKLVLACVLNDVPLRFVEDEALADALLALRPDFPRLTLAAAQTVVLDELCRAAAHGADEALPHLAHFAVVHRRQRGGSNLWIGLDGHRDPLLLAEITVPSSLSSSSSSSSSGGVTSDADLLMADAAAVLSRPLLRLPPTATLSFCTEDTELSRRLREWQLGDAAELPPASNDSSEAQESAPPDPRLKTVLVGACLLRQTMLLQRRLLELAPALVSVLQEATAVVCALVTHPRVTGTLRTALVDLAADPDGDGDGDDAVRWNLPARVVRRLVALEDRVRKFWAREQAGEGDVSSARGGSLLALSHPSFWADLHQVDALLAPFSWAFALSESTAGDVTSAQFVLLWLWLLALVHAPAPPSPVNLSADRREALTAHTLAAIRAVVGDHQFASILLDPRVHGAGLSATGKRKAKGLVTQAAARVFPSAGYHVAGSAARAALLGNLGHYAEKTAQFADEVAWEMSAGKPAEVFWKDYAEDACELATVARAALKFVPHVQSAAAVAAWTSSDAATAAACVNTQDQQQQPQQQAEEPSERVAFRIRQIKQLYQKSAGGARDGSSAEAAVARHASVLLPICKDAIEARKGGSASPPARRAGLEAVEKTAASRLLRATTEQIERMRTVGGKSSVESESRSAPEAADAADAAPCKRKAEIAVNESWFAFRSDAERRELEAAVRNFVSPSAALV